MVVAQGLTDALLGNPATVLSGRRNPFSMAPATWNMTRRSLAAGPSMSCQSHPAGVTPAPQGSAQDDVTTTPGAEQDAVFDGVDSHADTIHVTIITDRAATSPTPSSRPPQPDTPRQSRP